MAEKDSINIGSDLLKITFDGLDLENYDPIKAREEQLWDTLIDQIIKGNVIPVIGADLLIDNEDNLHKIFIQKLADSWNITPVPESFSELIHSYGYNAKNLKPDDIYFMVDKLCNAAESLSPSSKLKKLLEIKQFPFILTTSFTNLIEHHMRTVWKDELKILCFRNDPQQNDDIRDELDLRKPTIYYMLGKYGAGAHRYVLTDLDMLSFVSSWLSKDGKSRPKNLCNELKDKYLLMLGNDHNNWLFRFIWYSMRSQKHKDLGHGMLAYDNTDEALVRFLQRTETFTKQNTAYVIDQIVSRLDKKLKENELNKFNKPLSDMDVFISYSRRDHELVEKLYSALTKQGIKVWYDKNNICAGGKFMDDIEKAIYSTKYFVPVLTSSIELEKNDSHVYRNEWDKALSVATSLGRTYMIPVSEESFDFYGAKVPEKLKQYTAVQFSEKSGMDGIDKVVEQIIHTMNQN